MPRKNSKPKKRRNEPFIDLTEDDFMPEEKPKPQRPAAPAKEDRAAAEPGKHRFFEQNYQHKLYANGDGYGIAYQLEVNQDDRYKLDKFLQRKGLSEEFEDHVLEFIEEGFIVHETWDRFERDLKNVSAKVKNALLRVVCTGEDLPEDLCVYFALNGKAYYEDVQIIYPDFDATRLL